jgi:hypothetical protein
LSTHVILKYTPCVVESVVHDGVDVLMPEMVVGATGDDQIGPGNVQLHAYVVLSAVLVMMGRRLDRHAATRNAVGKRRQLAHALTDVLIDRGRHV